MPIQIYMLPHPRSVQLPLLWYLTWQIPATLATLPSYLCLLSSASPLPFSWSSSSCTLVWNTPKWKAGVDIINAKFLCIPLSHGSQFFSASFPTWKESPHLFCPVLWSFTVGKYVQYQLFHHGQKSSKYRIKCVWTLWYHLLNEWMM